MSPAQTTLAQLIQRGGHRLNGEGTYFCHLHNMHCPDAHHLLQRMLPPQHPQHQLASGCSFWRSGIIQSCVYVYLLDVSRVCSIQPSGSLPRTMPFFIRLLLSSGVKQDEIKQIDLSGRHLITHLTLTKMDSPWHQGRIHSQQLPGLPNSPTFSPLQLNVTKFQVLKIRMTVAHRSQSTNNI